MADGQEGGPQEHAVVNAELESLKFFYRAGGSVGWLEWNALGVEARAMMTVAREQVERERLDALGIVIAVAVGNERAAAEHAAPYDGGMAKMNVAMNDFIARHRDRQQRRG